MPPSSKSCVDFNFSIDSYVSISVSVFSNFLSLTVYSITILTSSSFKIFDIMLIGI